MMLTLIVFAFPSLCLASASVHVVCDRWYDTSSLAAFGNSAAELMEASTWEEKAIATWRGVQWCTYSEVVGDIIWTEENYGISFGVDPMKTLNVYGVHWCDGLSRLMQMTWEASTGLTARKYYHLGHTMAEIDWEDEDGVFRPHIFDCSQHWFVYDRSGSHIATAKELMNDASLIFRPSKGPIPLAPNSVGFWARRESGPIADPTLSITKTLRVGEKVTFKWGNDGKPYQNVFANFPPKTDAEHGPYTVDYGNAVWEYTPGVAAETTVFTMSFPYIVSEISCENTAGEIVSISTDGGSTWSSDLETGVGWYDYLIKVTAPAGNDNFTIKTYTQHNIFSLPQLWPGRNMITVSGTIEPDITLRVVYNWSDNGGVKQNVTEVESPEYTYEILTDASAWSEVVCSSLVLEGVSRVGGGNRTTVKEETPSVINTLTMAEHFSTNAMVGTVYKSPLDTVQNYVSALQSAVSAQEGYPTGSAQCRAQAGNFQNAIWGLMEHGVEAVDSLDPVIAAVKGDRSDPFNKMYGLQAIYRIAGSRQIMFNTIDDFFSYDDSIDWGEDEQQGWTHGVFILAAAQGSAILWDIGTVRCLPYTDTIYNFWSPEYIDEVITGEESVNTVNTWKWYDIRFAFINAYENIVNNPFIYGSLSLVPRMLLLLEE